MPTSSYTPQTEFVEKLERIKKLFDFHREIGGQDRGKRKAELQVLSESAMVLLYAAWENYVEFECVFWGAHIVVYCQKPELLPNKVKSFVAGKVQPAKGPLDAWIFSGQSWRREMLVSIAKEIFENHRADANTVNELSIARLVCEISLSIGNGKR